MAAADMSRSRPRLSWRQEADCEVESKSGRLPITSDPPLLSTLVAAFTGPSFSTGLRLYLGSDLSEERPSVQSLPHASLTFTLAQQFDWCLPYLKHQPIKLHQTNDKIKLSMKLHICGTFCAVNWCCMRGATLKVTWNVQDFRQDGWKSFLKMEVWILH